MEQAEHFRRLKEQTSHLPTRYMYEQLEASYRILARSQDQLNKSNIKLS